MVFKDRLEAGEILAEELEKYRGVEGVVLAIPRGGVVLGYVIAKALDLPLDVIITRKIGAPGNPEFAIGAVAQDGTKILNENTMIDLGISQEYIEENAAEQIEVIARRMEYYRGSDVYDLKGKTAIVVDDGLATGHTAMAAVKYVRKLGPSKLVFAVPVGSPYAVEKLKLLVDECICPETPRNFQSVSQFYEQFKQVSDDEVVELLRKL
ncbi:MAG: phosphoribosyltransferase [Candidatus Hydrothermarchaeales archaeon]